MRLTGKGTIRNKTVSCKIDIFKPKAKKNQNMGTAINFNLLSLPAN